MAFPAIFAILVGLGMTGQWRVSYLAKQIPELQSEPFRIRFHSVAEMCTAASLLVAGVGLLLSAQWASSLYWIA